MRKVYVLVHKTEDIIEAFGTLREAAACAGVSYNQVRRWLNGEQESRRWRVAKRFVHKRAANNAQSITKMNEAKIKP